MSFVTKHDINLPNALKLIGLAIVLGDALFSSGGTRIALFAGALFLVCGWAFGKIVGQ